jgi:uncharacterized protein YdhG (YjbR/CyaY superfamily)
VAGGAETTVSGGAPVRLTRACAPIENRAVSEREIDEYLAAVPEPARATLEELRRTILGVVADADQCIAYGMPAFRVGGKVVAGFGAFRHHLSYFPHSGSVLPRLADEIADYAHSAGTLRFGIDAPLPEQLVRRLIEVRMSQLAEREPPPTDSDRPR